MLRWQWLTIAILTTLPAGCSGSDADAPTGSARAGKSVADRTGFDWPRFLGPTGDGKSAETGITTQWGPTGLPIVWRRPLGTGYGIGSVAGGRFFQFDRLRNRAQLVCLNAQTGDRLWEFEYEIAFEDLLGYNNGPRSSPVVDGDRVYVFGPEGMLHCLRVQDGQPIWKVDTARRFGVVQNFFGVGSTPVVEGDLLIVMVGGSPAESQNIGRMDLDRAVGNGTGIVAFDKRTGQLKYAITDELASYSTPQLATIGNRRWCFAFARGGLIAFEPFTGTVDFRYAWRSRLRDSVNVSTPVVVGDEVLISEGYGPGSSLLKVRPGGYEVVWSDPPTRNKAMLCHINTPIYHDGYLYGSSGRHSANAELRCVEWKTGKVMWRQPGLGLSSLLYADGHFVCLSEDGVLRLIKATHQAYQEVAKAEIRESPDSQPLLKPPAWAAPILSHGLLYVRGDDQLVCLRLIPKGRSPDE